MGKLTDTFQQVREAGKSLAFCGEEKINEVLRAVADATESQAGQILSENAKDLARMDESDPKYDRLKLTTERIHGIAEGIRSVTRLPSPVGRVLSETLRPNGMKLTKVSVPFGVIGIVYEARPNVTLDVFSLCFKSGMACLLKGSGCRLFQPGYRVGHSFGIDTAGLNPNLVVLLPLDRESAAELLNARGYVDLLIPRGGKGLIDFVRRNATVPVIETGAGVCHAYFDRSGDVTKGAAIIRNAKTRRVSVCNALDCVLVHRERVADLPVLCGGLSCSHVTIYADPEAFSACRKVIRRSFSGIPPTRVTVPNSWTIKWQSRCFPVLKKRWLILPGTVPVIVNAS